MNQQSVVLCEIAAEYFDDAENSQIDTEFVYGKKKWRIKTCLAERATEIVRILKNFERARTRKLCFYIFQSTLVLLQNEETASDSANALDLQLAAELFPILFKNYKPTLEFEVVREQYQRQRELKSYVTTQLYNALYSKHQEQEQALEANKQELKKEKTEQTQCLPSCFESQLRKYQERTVNWMINRECQTNEITANCTVLIAADGHHQVLKHNYCLHFYVYQNPIPNFTLPPGGILADEMGLGKTVELLATVLLNPRLIVDNSYWHNCLDSLEDDVPLKLRRRREKLHCICVEDKRSQQGTLRCARCRLQQHRVCVKDTDEYTYMCPNCWTQLTANCDQLVESRTTIIVSPNAIKKQWLQEISKHISSSLKVLLYPGLHSGVWISPMLLAQYDIVLTDYAILAHEIHHTPKNSTHREMRYEQRYMRPNSPLLMVNWWRVCLDEAQMVESGTSQVAEMVRRLPAINRWAVTGTPIQRTIDDLAPLLKFVGFTAACEPLDAWQTVANSFLLNHNVEPLLELLKHIMWRTCKSKVEDELGIPPQTEIVHRLELSNVESLYYREEHTKCTELFLAAVAKHTNHRPSYDNSCLASISPKLLRIILQPFLCIRKTCSIPVVANKSVATANYLNPQDLLEHLKSNNEMQCKRELRTWASSYNGIAAIHFIRKDYDQAIRNYKLVLQLAKDYNGEAISVDSLLQIHALHNMIQASVLAPEKDQLSETDLSNFSSKLNSLECKYLEDTSAVMKSARNEYELILNNLNKLQQTYKSSILELFATLINTYDSSHNVLWNKIADELFRQNVSQEKLQDITSMSGILCLLNNWHDHLQQLESQLRTEFEYLKKMLLQACGAVENGVTLVQEALNFIKTVSDCHLADILLEDNPDEMREKLKNSKICRLCKTRELVNQFECLLFAQELAKDGVKKPSVEIVILKVTFTLYSRTEEWLSECKNKLEMLDCMQNLVKLRTKYWIEVEFVIKSFDELDMCKMRLLLTDNPNEKSIYRILPYQLDEQTQFNLTNIEESQLNFMRLAGRLKYLKHLKEDTDDKPCPICQTQDDERFVMLSCGHFLCQHCLDIMKRQSNREFKTKCPLCRQESPQLYYYVRKDANGSKVFGDFSTKITYIVEQLLKIKSQCVGNQQEKVLIFSQWSSILNHISIALGQNGIVYRSKFTNRDIEDFKNPALDVMCLLMPLLRGSKGLNLIEATHVFLVEPILTPGEELQAIGRVHRFGQTKPTTVHRFIVNGTIEENILTLIKSADDRSTLSTHWDLDNMTLESLTNLFMLKEAE